MGQNIGTCVTAMLSSLGTNKNAKRASLIHLSSSVIGTAIWLTVFSIISAIFKPLILQEQASFLGIAACHTIFNVLCVAILLPASSLLEKLTYVIIPDTADDKEEKVELDDRLLATPAIALAQSVDLANKMARRSVEGFKLSIESLTDYTPEKAARVRELEKKVDRYEDVLGTFLAKLSQHLSASTTGHCIIVYIAILSSNNTYGSKHSLTISNSRKQRRSFCTVCKRI
jgi:phosphate:Na+ symporter